MAEGMLHDPITAALGIAVALSNSSGGSRESSFLSRSVGIAHNATAVACGSVDGDHAR